MVARSLTVLVCFFTLMASARPSMAGWENSSWAVVFEPFADARGLAVSSDGYGGMLLAIQNDDIFPSGTLLSRLSKVGTEIWGNGGRGLPQDIIHPTQFAPLAVAPDGSGGAYCAYVEWWTTQGLLRLARLDPDGNMLWSEAIDWAGTNPGTVGVKLVAYPNNGVIVGYATSGPSPIVAARYDFDGNLQWGTVVNQYYEHNIWLSPVGGYTDFDMRTDGQGGALFGWYRYDEPYFQTTPVYFEEAGVQRISSNGTAMWGPDGVMVWENPGFPHTTFWEVRTVQDGNGGAYVITSGGERVYAQHVNSLGALTWAGDGVVVQTLGTGANSGTAPELCEDGVGGFILVHSFGHIYAQRVDAAGSLLWGPTGIRAVDSTGYGFFSNAAIAADGFGGAVVGFERWDQGAEILGGARLDAFGNVLWSSAALFVPSGDQGLWDVRVVADGSGGAKYAWQAHDNDTNTDDVYAMGVSPTGGEPHPTLLYIAPDAGEPGEVQPVAILGDYLEDTQEFSLEQPGSGPFDVGQKVMFDHTFIGGIVDLAGAQVGAYELRASVGGQPKDVLTDAYGVGPLPPCDAQDAIVTLPDVESFGSPRKAAVDSQGRVHMVTIESDGGVWDVIYHLLTGGEVQSTYVFGSTAPDFRDATIALTPDDRPIIAFVDDLGASEVVELIEQLPDGSFSVSQIPDSPDSKSNPVVAVRPNSDVFVVYERQAGGNPGLITYDAGNVVYNPTAGANPRNPDITVHGSDVIMTYTRDSFWPGVFEVCMQRYQAGAWTVPIVIHFGLDVRSPSVVSDGSDVLFAWVVDNTGGSAPLLHTSLMQNDVLGPVRWRIIDQQIYRCVVGTQGPGQFALMTQETGQPMQILLRTGDGNVFFPKRRVNMDDDVDFAVFAAGSQTLFAAWEDYSQGQPERYMSYFCQNAVTAVEGDVVPVVASRLAAVPNPFNPITQVHFALPRAAWVKLSVYDMQGRRVRLLADQTFEAGDHSVVWNGSDDRGQSLASAVYLVRMQSPATADQMLKTTLLK